VTTAERGGFFGLGDVVTRSHGAACHLVALGHEVLEVRHRDSAIRFPASARPDLERFYAARDRLNQAIRATPSTDN
jgi:hypothetical protein